MRSFLLSGFLALAAVSASAQPLALQLPNQLRGAWSMGDETCRLPRNLYDEGVIRIGARRIDAYESTFTARRITRATSYLTSWRMDTVEDSEGEVYRSSSLYVLSGDVLRILQGRHIDRYVRCRAAKRSGQAVRRP